MNSNSVSFPTRKNEKRKWKCNFVFSLQRAKKDENKIWVSFSYAIENRWALRIIALSLCLSPGTLQYTVHTSIIAAKIVSLKSLFEPRYFGPDLRLARTKTAIPIRSVQTADRVKKCLLGSKYGLQTADRVQNADWEFVLPFRLILVTCRLTTYRASRKRFYAIISHDYLHYCGIFLACFLITIVLTIISSLI